MSKVLLTGIIVAGFTAVTFLSYKIQTHIETATIEVVSKERLLNLKTDSDGKSSSTWTNFVYAKDETYVVEDSFWNWHFTARTVYAKLQEGAKCDVTLSGYRLGFLSMHQNIIAADCY
jgi:hypothetical protein